MQQKKIILFLIILFVASSVWLFGASDRLTDPNRGKNWWAIYFVEPKSKNLEFTIENHNDKTDFHWIILAQNQKIKEGDAKIEKGSSKNIIPGDIQNSGKVTVEVVIGDEKKEIYKNL